MAKRGRKKKVNTTNTTNPVKKEKQVVEVKATEKKSVEAPKSLEELVAQNMEENENFKSVFPQEVEEDEEEISIGYENAFIDSEGKEESLELIKGENR